MLKFLRHMLALLGMFLLPVCSMADDVQSPGSAESGAFAVDTPADADIQWLENIRRYTHTGSHYLVESVDGWFGGDSFDESGGAVSGYIRLGTLWEQDDGMDARVRFKLKARLPNLEKRAYIFIGRDNRDEEITDQPDTFRKEQLLERERRSEDQSFFAGLGYALHDNIDFRLGVHGALRPYVQARYRHRWRFSPRTRVYFRESLFWSTREHFGSTTTVDYEHDLTRTLLLRWANVGTVSQRSDGFEWQSSLGLFKDLPSLRMISAEALVKGRTSKVDVSDYGVRLAWSQPIYKDWMFGKLTVGHFWPKHEHEHRHASWAVGLSVETQF